jgi:hypothetical protein
MNIWIVPAVDPFATANVKKTLSRPISADRMMNAGLTAESDLHAWGPPLGERNRDNVNRMCPGDPCVFYTKNEYSNVPAFHWIAKFTRLPDAPAINVSRAFWGSTGFIPYLLDPPHRIHISLDEMCQELGYSENWWPRKFMRIGEKARHTLRTRHGSPHHWILGLLHDHQAV